MLDDGFVLFRLNTDATGFSRSPDPLLEPERPVEEEVEVAVGGGLDPDDAVDGPERRGQLLRDGARGLAQAPREGERDGDGDIAQGAPRRHFQRHFGNRRIVGGQGVESADGVGDAAANELMDGQNHKLFRDTIFGRFLIQFNPTPGARVIMRRVDVLEQRSRVVGGEHLRPELANPEVRQQSRDPQIPAIDPGPHGAGRARHVQRAQRFEPARRSRHHRINLLAGPAFLHEALEECRGDKRQIAREDQDAFVRGVEQGGIQAAERSRAGHRVGDDAQTAAVVAVAIAGDDPDVVRHRGERGALAIDDPLAADGERALVGAAEASRAASGQDGSRDAESHADILLRALPGAGADLS